MARLSTCCTIAPEVGATDRASVRCVLQARCRRGQGPNIACSSRPHFGSLDLMRLQLMLVRYTCTFRLLPIDGPRASLKA